VLDLREPDGVMRVRLADAECEIEVPLGHAAPGDRVRIAIRAGDILLATESPRALSARNVLEGQITALERRGALVSARVDCGVIFHRPCDTGRGAGVGPRHREKGVACAEDALLPFRGRPIISDKREGRSPQELGRPGDSLAVDELKVTGGLWRDQSGGCMRPILAARHSRRTAVPKHKMTAIMEASGPNEPPVRISGPCRIP